MDQVLKFREELWLVLQKNKAKTIRIEKRSSNSATAVEGDEIEGEEETNGTSVCNSMPRDWYPNHWLPFVLFGKFSGDPNSILEGSKDEDAKPLKERVNSRVFVRALTEEAKSTTNLVEEGKKSKNSKSVHALSELKKELREIKDFYFEENKRNWLYIRWQNQLSAMDSIIREAIEDGVDDADIKEMKQKRRKIMFADPLQEDSLLTNAICTSQPSSAFFPNNSSNFVDESSIIASSDTTSFNESVYNDNEV